MDNFAWVSTHDCLPSDGELVLVWFGGWGIARFERGITVEQRSAMKSGEIDDPIEEIYAPSTGRIRVPRSSIYREGDVCFNNEVPFCWNLSYGSYLHGQDVSHWAHLPDAPVNKKPE